jgi:hypothetical protein
MANAGVAGKIHKSEEEDANAFLTIPSRTDNAYHRMVEIRHKFRMKTVKKIRALNRASQYVETVLLRVFNSVMTVTPRMETDATRNAKYKLDLLAKTLLLFALVRQDPILEISSLQIHKIHQTIRQPRLHHLPQPQAPLQLSPQLPIPLQAQ